MQTILNLILNFIIAVVWIGKSLMVMAAGAVLRVIAMGKKK